MKKSAGGSERLRFFRVRSPAAVRTQMQQLEQLGSGKSMQRPAAHGRLRGYQIAGQILSASEPLPEPVRSPAAVRTQMQQLEQLGSGKSMQRPAAHGRLRGYQIAGQILNAPELLLSRLQPSDAYQMAMPELIPCRLVRNGSGSS